MKSKSIKFGALLAVMMMSMALVPAVNAQARSEIVPTECTGLPL